MIQPPQSARKASQSEYSAALIVIGNEILSGRTQDQNINWIACKLAEKGIRFSEVRIVPDIAERVVSAVRELSARYDYLFTTGGIGPTHDDITAGCVAQAFETPIVENEEARAMLERHYGGPEHLNPARLKMAQIPRGGTLIPNPVSGAPGFVIENVYVMAGVPKIMQAMLDHVLPGLAGGDVLLSRTVSSRFPESRIALKLADIQESWPDVEIGSYPQFKDGKFGVSVVLRSANEGMLEAAERDVKKLIAELEQG